MHPRLCRHRAAAAPTPPAAHRVIHLRGFPENVEPVADLHLFQLAEIIVELGQRLIGRLIRGNPAIEIETGRPGQFENTVAKQFDAARIDACGLIVFVDQPFEIGQRPISLGTG